MLEIIIDEQIIDIQDDFAGIDLQINSLLLTEQGQYSFTFSVPHNKINEEKLDIYVFTKNYNILKRKSCFIKYNSFLIEGFVNITNVKIDDEIELNFVGWENTFFSQTKKLKLTELGYSTAFTGAELNTACLNNNGIYCLFPVDISTPKNIDLLKLVSAQTYWNDKVYLNYYVVNPSPTLKTLVQASNLQAATPDATEVYAFTNHIVSYIVPFYYVNHVLKKIFEYFGINIESNPFDSGDLNDLAIVYNGKFFTFLGNGTISFEDHLPDITVNEFLREIEKVFDLRFVLNPFKQSVKIVFLKDVAKNFTIQDFPGKVSKIKEMGTIDPKNYYYTQNIDFDLFLTQSDFPNFNVIEDPEYDIITKEINASFLEELTGYMNVQTFSSIFTTWYYNRFYRIFMGYDIVEGQSNGKLFEDSKPFRLAFHTTQTENAYLLWRSDGVTSDLVTGIMPRGTPVKGLYSLQFNQANKGLYEVFYENPETWKNKFAKKTIINSRLNSDELAGFDFTQKYNVDDIAVLVKTIPVRLRKNKIEIGDIEAVTV